MGTSSDWREATDFEVASPAYRSIALGKGGYNPPACASRRYQVHGPAAKPVLSLRRSPDPPRYYVAVETAHLRVMYRNPTVTEVDLVMGPAAMADGASPRPCAVLANPACQAVARLRTNASDEGM
jgi:hypothetical protein